MFRHDVDPLACCRKPGARPASGLGFSKRFTVCCFFISWAAALPGVAQNPSPSKPSVPAAPVSAEDAEFFEREVRPILAERCWDCHGARQKALGGLRLDSRAAVLAGGETGPAAVPGDPMKSLLVDAINYGDTFQMPPKTRLAAREVAVLTRWVQRGLPWPEHVGKSPEPAPAKETFDIQARRDGHWCWRPVQQVALPEVQDRNWPRQPLDRFILARLEQEGLSPAADADRRMLLRRLSFDLLGLPPTPAEVEQFVQDSNPQAWEQWVDRYLDSRHFGERWARHWLDLVRYAETCGHEFDYPIHQAWQYRNYLVRAFNADVPYDQLVREHLAGDLLPNPRIHPTEGFDESVLGTAFWFLHEAIHAPVDVRGDEAGRIDNQIDVFSKTFLGLTVACARCHDHKFDAISTQDYYALAGFLRSSRRQEVLLDLGGKIAAAAREADQVRTAANQQIRGLITVALQQASRETENYLLALQAATAAPKTDGAPPAAVEMRLEQAARERGLSVDRLRSWHRAIQKDSAGASTPDLIRLWRELTSTSTPNNPSSPEQSKTNAGGEAFSPRLAAWQRLTSERAAKRPTPPPREILAHFEEGADHGWTATGMAFPSGPARIGDWDAEASGLRVVESGMVHSGLRHSRFQGVLRSPSFTLTTNNIYYRIAGRGCEVRLIIDGHTMIEFHQLLFKGTKFPVNSDGKWTWHRQAEDLGMYRGHRAHIELIDHGDGWGAIDQVVLSDQELPDLTEPSPSADSPGLLALAADTSIRTDVDLAGRVAGAVAAAAKNWEPGTPTTEDTRWWNWLAEHNLVDTSALFREAQAARQRVEQLTVGLPNPPRIVAMTDGNGENERVMIRGNHRLLGPEVPRQLLTALVGQRPIQSPGSGRLELANQVANPENPLTSRVLVNRVWHHLLGVGIVPTVDNFGVLGETPSHPELLDFLATEFVREGWSIKRLIRSIVLSRTYQMSSNPSPQGTERDPSNRWWHRAHLRRLEGEAVRDAVLRISGRLDPQVGGPPVPVHITPFMQGRGKPAASGPLDGDGRRSIYTEVRRNFLPPMLLAFDLPIPFSTVGRRNTSNVPAQALILMNDPFIAEQAGRWASRLLADEAETFAQRLRHAYIAAIARPPTETEIAEVRAFFQTQAREYQLADAAAERDPRVWTDFCHVLWNVKEFVFLH